MSQGFGCEVDDLLPVDAIPIDSKVGGLDVPRQQFGPRQPGSTLGLSKTAQVFEEVDLDSGGPAWFFNHGVTLLLVVPFMVQDFGDIGDIGDIHTYMPVIA